MRGFFNWSVKPMQISDFEYDLPPAQIAQVPTAHRTDSRLLQLTADGCLHKKFSDITQLLRRGDLLVVNNTRVVKARLFAVKDSGGQAEILFERLLDNYQALCQVRVSKPLKVGRVLKVAGVALVCRGRVGQFYQLESERPFLALMEQYGHVPLPPYIERADAPDDQSRYQTVYGQIPGAVAAPTAGLHFSAQLLEDLQTSGVELAEVTLHVGAGTFAPVRGDLDEHKMHQELYHVSEQAAAQINRAKDEGRRVVAVGTTVVRTLESAALAGGGVVKPGSGETELFIRPGFHFQIVDALVTNFHLPGSTLIMLVCAFSGYERVMAAYRLAVDAGYRFFSYGDAMWLERKWLERKRLEKKRPEKQRLEQQADAPLEQNHV
jgi:S-adenosylmethionine:tRNA ribosyltransferase-isomerase